VGGEVTPDRFHVDKVTFEITALAVSTDRRPGLPAPDLSAIRARSTESPD